MFPSQATFGEEPFEIGTDVANAMDAVDALNKIV